MSNYDGTNPDLVRLYYRQNYAGRTAAYCKVQRAHLLPRLMRERDSVEIERLRSDIRAADNRIDEVDAQTEGISGD